MRNRRPVAYRISASDGLPRSVRVATAAALEALDNGLDAEHARAAVKDLILAVYGCRGSRGLPGSATATGGRGGLAGVARRLRCRMGSCRERRRSFPAS